ncbi:MAG TPA: GDSL-type esterase/lipase family protein [Planctomycetota bacterium]|nr:GDSL-type esterase/lipase family protein [Planctomycetota bacterium]
MRLIALLMLGLCGIVCAEDVKRGEWNGYEKHEFAVNGRKAFVVLPKTAAEGKPWIWRTEFFGHEPQGDLALLARGFHAACIDMQNMYGAPVAMGHMDAFYAHLVKNYGLAPKTVLEGFSRGGLFAFNWAAKNPEKVAALYVDAPVCDFKSWPGGKGKGKGSASDWKRCLEVYGLSEEQALAYKLNPVDNLAPIAAAKIPILSVCGETDDVVPFAENTRLVEERYKQLGGPITVIAKPHCNHHPHSLKDPTRIVNFILQNTGHTTLITDQPQTPYGYDYYALRAGLNNSRVKFEKGGQARVAFLGGSITNMKGWRDLVCAELQRRFPNTTFDFINAGIPSTGSTPGAFRFARDVLGRGPVDLLFEEAAVNDDTNGFTPVEQIRGMEGIVRQARLANPEMDVVLLHFVDPGKIAEYNAGKVPVVIANHDKVAEHYGAPSINLAREVAERIHAGEFTWAGDFKNLHPSPFGHKLYAESIKRLFDAAWKNAPGPVKPHALPQPLDGQSYFAGRLVELNAATFDAGWSIDPSWKPNEKIGTREGFVNVPMLVAEKPGATLKLKFEGTAAGIFVAAGPDAGSVEYSIDGGAWATRDLFTAWSTGLHLPWAYVLAAELSPGEHELELRVAETANSKSKGHAVRIVHFLVNGSAVKK